ncbi:glutamate 5-kinase [Agrilactobacillus fermenti]|uniref:glutamate 5-kinase n=1 Tax=Agrilactobacillus fermenti TaxID=2586909 RepID=UPI003A5B93B1
MLRQINPKRIVVKIGTSSLVLKNRKLNLRAIARLAFVLTDLCNRGIQVVLVSSGAMGVGIGMLHLKDRPSEIPQQQAVSAIGQSQLIGIYTKEFAEYQQIVAQVLLTRDVMLFPESKRNVVNAFKAMMGQHIIPIVNENDSVSVDELDHQTSFSDNDELSAIVTEIIDADLLIVLSDIDGFYTGNPYKDPDAVLIPEVHAIDADILAYAGGSSTQFGTGGMTTKLNAARRILEHHRQMILANGRDPEIIFDILDGKEIGTLFTTKVMKARV